MTPAPQVSLVVVTYKSAHLLPAFVHAIRQHTHHIDYELIFVDNASGDHPASLNITAHWIDLPHNIGYGSACNAGIAQAKAPIVVCMNPDVVVTAHWLDPLIDALVTHSDIGIIAPESPRDHQHYRRHAAIYDRPTLSGAVMAMRHATWRQLGGFDPQIFLYWEDTDICWRAQRHGYRTAVAADSLVIHQRGGSGGGSAWRHQYIQNGIYVHLKLQPWPTTMRFLARQFAHSLYRGWTNPAIWRAWWWNIVHLRHTLAMRRHWQHIRSSPPETV